MKRFKLLPMLALVLMVCSPSYGQFPGNITTGTETLRAAAIVTTGTAELTTTFSLESRPTAVLFYVNFTLGSLTNATFGPVGYPDNTASTNAMRIKKPIDYDLTLTTSDQVQFRVPYEAFGAKAGGFRIVGTGTQVGSSATVRYRFEY